MDSSLLLEKYAECSKLQENVYFIGSILSRYQITAPNVRKRLVSYSFHGKGVMYP